jgi:hypothetical protein
MTTKRKPTCKPDTWGTQIHFKTYRMGHSLGVLGEGFLDGGVDGEKLGEASDLDDGVALLGEGGEGKAFAGASAVDEKLDERADSGRVQKGDAAHIEDELGGGFGAQGLNEIVNCFDAQFAGKAGDEAVGAGCRESFQIELDGLHKDAA